MIIGHKLNFMTIDFDAQMQYFMIRVANFRPLYLKQFWIKIQSFCAHWTRNFLNFLKLTQLLSVAHFWMPLRAFKRKSPFFWDTLYNPQCHFVCSWAKLNLSLICVCPSETPNPSFDSTNSIIHRTSVHKTIFDRLIGTKIPKKNITIRLDWYHQNY